VLTESRQAQDLGVRDESFRPNSSTIRFATNGKLKCTARYRLIFPVREDGVEALRAVRERVFPLETLESLGSSFRFAESLNRI
jgi:hypothetical protein